MEVLNAMIKHQTQVRIQPLAGKKNHQSCRKQKQSKHFFLLLDTHRKSQNKINRGPYLNIPLRHLPLSRLNLPCALSPFFLFLPFLPLAIFPFPPFSFLQPSPTLCSFSNLAAPISLIPGVVRRVIMIEKNPPQKLLPGRGFTIPYCIILNSSFHLYHLELKFVLEYCMINFVQL